MTTRADTGVSVLASGAVVVPGYEVVAHLSRGADLDVYDAWSLDRQCRCVVKVLRPDQGGNRSVARRLINEGTLLTRITHPHLVRCFEVVRGSQPAVVLETLCGQTLSHLIESRGSRLPIIDLAFLGMHLTSAVGYLHRNGVLHLDVKPSNVVCQAGKAIVIDLSLARPEGRAPKGCGTAQYLSPEQARGGSLGPAADVWGIGATLFHAATGVRPFPASADGQYVQLTGSAPAIRTHRRVPGWFGELIDSCLSPTPSGRPTMVELAADLEAPFA